MLHVGFDQGMCVPGFRTSKCTLGLVGLQLAGELKGIEIEDFKTHMVLRRSSSSFDIYELILEFMLICELLLKHILPNE